MRDFKAGRDINIDGNVVIHDSSSNQPKPLSMCSIEELNEEYNHPAKLLKEERASRRQDFNIGTCIALAVGIAIAIYYWLSDLRFYIN